MTSRQLESVKARYRRLKAEGLCPICKSPAAPGSVSCIKCLEYKRETYRIKMRDGICSRCGEPRDEGGTATLCSVCRKIKNIKLREARRREKCL